MTHDNFTEKISLWLDNELSPTEVTELQTHLARCPACQQTYQAIQRVDGFLHQASTAMAEPRPGFTVRFEARLAQQNAKRWHMWVGLTVLLIGALVFAGLGVMVAGPILLGASSTWLTWPVLYYWLGEVGGVVNHIRALINLGGLFFKVAFIAMSQPLFWGLVVVTIALTATWVRVMQLLYRRAPITTLLFV